jgi:hypothetical protein
LGQDLRRIRPGQPLGGTFEASGQRGLSNTVAPGRRNRPENAAGDKEEQTRKNN